MIGEVMSRHSLSFNRHSRNFINPLSREASYKRRFARALQAWNDADSLAADIGETLGVFPSERTCQRWRSGESMPRDKWMQDELLKMAVAQTRQQIRALEQRLEAIEE